MPRDRYLNLLLFLVLNDPWSFIILLCRVPGALIRFLSRINSLKRLILLGRFLSLGVHRYARSTIAAAAHATRRLECFAWRFSDSLRTRYPGNNRLHVFANVDTLPVPGEPPRGDGKIYYLGYTGITDATTEIRQEPSSL